MKEKAGVAQPARDLYQSTLFAGRRWFVERTCTEWWILSAEHGLVHPDQVLEPYDEALKSLGRGERRAWSQQVLASIREQVHPTPADAFELHAGAEYREFGLEAGLMALGCVVDVPTRGMKIGAQLGFYKRANT